jgi:acyl carrier protein
VTIWFTEVFTVKQINQFNKTTTMDLEEIKNRVKKVTAKVLEIDESELSDSANFSFDLGASSIQSILLVAAFQEEFNIEMDEEKSLEIQTISEAAEFISGYLD